MIFPYTVLLFVVSLCLVVSNARGFQSAGVAVPAEAAVDKPFEDPNAAVQRVGPDDLLSIAVANLPELTRSFRVSADGSLQLPMLTQRVQAAGKSTPEVEEEIAAALVRDEVLVRPVVAVSITEYRSAPVSVLGAVRHPITFQAFGDVRLMDAITKADGLTESAGSEILVTRSHESRTGQNLPSVERIPIRQLINDADQSVNIRLYGGEQIRIPEAGHVYVVGNVKRSGVLPVTDNGDMTVLKALAQSEGLLPYAEKTSFIYRRERGKAERTEVAINIRDILAHKSPDVLLQENDILYVPDDRHKRLTMQTIDRISGFGVATASGLLIYSH